MEKPKDRDRLQNRIVSQIIDIHAKSPKTTILYEIPTGFGKTWISGKLAQRLLDSDKKIIISSYTNKLVYDLRTIVKKLLPPDKRVGIVLGKNNYIDIEKLKENRDKIQEFCDNNSIDEYIAILESDNPPERFWLVDTFIERALLDPDMERVVKDIISADERIKQAGTFKDYDVSITNHFYLLSNFFYKVHKDDSEDGQDITGKSFNPDEYEIILDEVHTISQAADAMFATSFSPYRLAYLLNEFKTAIGEHAKKKTVRTIENIEKKMRALSLIHARKEHANEYFKSTDTRYQLFLEDLKKMVDKRKLTELSSSIDLFVAEKKLKVVYSLRKEIRELNAVLDSKYGTGFIKYSPNRGYPSIVFQRSDAGYALTNLFWKRKSGIIGMSATITPSYSGGSSSDLGIANILGYRARESMQYIFFRVPFMWSRKQKTFIIDDEDKVPNPPKVGSETEMGDNESAQLKEWGEFVARVVTNTYEGKKAVVLSGSYLQVKAIYTALLQKGIDRTQVLISDSDRTISSIINQFTDNDIKILIAARHYGVGIDLPGKLLEKLYIARLPFPVLTFKWLVRKHRYGSDYIDETIINLRQWMGRLLRSEDDEGDLYILDQRIHKKEVWSRVEGFIKERSKEITYFKLENF